MSEQQIDLTLRACRPSRLAQEVCLPVVPDQASSDRLILGLLGLRLE